LNLREGKREKKKIQSHRRSKPSEGKRVKQEEKKGERRSKHSYCHHHLSRGRGGGRAAHYFTEKKGLGKKGGEKGKQRPLLYY